MVYVVHFNKVDGEFMPDYLHSKTCLQVSVTAGSLRGLHHALVTLAQLLRLSASEEGLAPVLIQDHPQLNHRGVLLDISQLSRIPALV